MSSFSLFTPLFFLSDDCPLSFHASFIQQPEDIEQIHDQLTQNFGSVSYDAFLTFLVSSRSFGCQCQNLSQFISFPSFFLFNWIQQREITEDTTSGDQLLEAFAGLANEKVSVAFSLLSRDGKLLFPFAKRLLFQIHLLLLSLKGVRDGDGSANGEPFSKIDRLLDSMHASNDGRWSWRRSLWLSGLSWRREFEDYGSRHLEHILLGWSLTWLSFLAWPSSSSPLAVHRVRSKPFIPRPIHRLRPDSFL